MRYLLATLMMLNMLPARAADADSSNALLRYRHWCVVADAGGISPYVRYGQSFGLQQGNSNMMQLGGEVHFNKIGRLTGYVAGLRVGYVNINTHYHSYMPHPYEAPSQNLQIAALGGLRGTKLINVWMDVIVGAQAGPICIISTSAGGATVSAYGEAHVGIRFNHRFTTGVKFFLSPGIYKQYYDNRSTQTLGYGASGLITEMRIELGRF